MGVAAGIGAVDDGDNDGEDEPDPEEAGVPRHQDLVDDELDGVAERRDQEDHEVEAGETGVEAGVALVVRVLGLVRRRDHVALDKDNLRLRLSGIGRNGGNWGCFSHLN